MANFLPYTKKEREEAYKGGKSPAAAYAASMGIDREKHKKIGQFLGRVPAIVSGTAALGPSLSAVGQLMGERAEEIRQRTGIPSPEERAKIKTERADPMNAAMPDTYGDYDSQSLGRIPTLPSQGDVIARTAEGTAIYEGQTPRVAGARNQGILSDDVIAQTNKNIRAGGVLGEGETPGDWRSRMTVNAGPGKGSMSDEQWNALSNQEKIARNVASFEDQTAAVRSVNNARQAAEGSSPVGVARTPSVGLGGGTSSGGGGFDRIPTGASGGFDYTDFSTIQNPKDRRAMMGLAGGLAKEEMQQQGQLERAQIAQMPGAADAAEQEQSAFERQMDLLGAQQAAQGLGIKSAGLDLNYQKAMAEQESRSGRDAREEQKFANEQITQIAQSSALGDALSPILADQATIANHDPRATLIELQELLSREKNAHLQDLLVSRDESVRKDALANLRALYDEALQKKAQQ